MLTGSLAILCVLIYLAWAIHRPLTLKMTEVEVWIAPGSSAKMVAQTLQDSGVPLSVTVFTWVARLSGQAHKIKAGNYVLRAQTANEPAPANANTAAAPLSLWQILGKLTRGDVSQREIRFIEGWTFRQWRQVLNQHPDLRHDTLNMTDQEIMTALGEPQLAPEGWFMPDTYLFDRQTSDLAILRRAFHMQQQLVAQLWSQRPAVSPLNSAYQALILASIIEKETGLAAERAQIAAVFHNRLRRGMLLQTDPTVIYGLGAQFDGNLRKRDLLSDTPFNTYTRPGLPPTPIAMPGRAALQAAIHPAISDALYFVARGDGSSYFSRNLEEHNRAVTRYQRGNRP
ncbi:endolytic transglycosylase MltG [Parvibium lacunae]